MSLGANPTESVSGQSKVLRCGSWNAGTNFVCSTTRFRANLPVDSIILVLGALKVHTIIIKIWLSDYFGQSKKSKIHTTPKWSLT